jgi:site-specific recombinase XerD
MNIHLKLIAKFAKIDKRLSTHIARHTYATTVALLNGLSMEVISNNLGHSSTRTTAIYGEIVQQKIGNEMQVLKEKVAGTYTYPAVLNPVA